MHVLFYFPCHHSMYFFSLFSPFPICFSLSLSHLVFLCLCFSHFVRVSFIDGSSFVLILALTVLYFYSIVSKYQIFPPYFYSVYYSPFFLFVSVWNPLKWRHWGWNVPGQENLKTNLIDFADSTPLHHLLQILKLITHVTNCLCSLFPWRILLFPNRTRHSSGSGMLKKVGGRESCNDGNINVSLVVCFWWEQASWLGLFW